MHYQIRFDAAITALFSGALARWESKQDSLLVQKQLFTELPRAALAYMVYIIPYRKPKVEL